MCGFLGFVSRSDVGSRLNEGLRLIAHRGPDIQKYEIDEVKNTFVGLGHARLSIIDLTAASDQPFSSSCGTFKIVFNGEIYNYREIRSELESLGFVFRTASDTEVLLTAWQTWGVEVLRKIVGMFSFVVLDKEKNKLTLVRDAFGIKPLYYAICDNGIYFGSDIRSLLPLMDVSPKPNLQSAYDYLVHGAYDTSDDTFLEGVKQLSPGEWFSVELSSIEYEKPEKWWMPNLGYTNNLSFAEATERTRELFLQSVEYHLRSDVPLGAALSGGIDSSAVVCAMRAIDPSAEIHTFSYIAEDDEISEEEWVDGINSYVGAIPHKVYSSGAEMEKDLDHMILMQGEPFGGTSIYAQYRVFKLAKECNITVTLDGQGADEALAGYSGYPGYRLLSLLEQGRFIQAHKFAKKWSDWPGRSYKNAWKGLLTLVLPESIYIRLREVTGNSFFPAWIDANYLKQNNVDFSFKSRRLRKEQRGMRVREVLHKSLTSHGLPTLLRHGDRNSMAFSIESRVPFLSLPLVEFLLSLPEEYLISCDGETKHVFREAMRGIVPDSHLNRRDKIGFATPEANWLIDMADQVRGWIKTSPDIPFIDKSALLSEFESIVIGKKRFNKRVWRWINYLRWYSLVINQNFG